MICSNWQSYQTQSYSSRIWAPSDRLGKIFWHHSLAVSTHELVAYLGPWGNYICFGTV